eukprot:GHVU01195127.1.p2 GENE.GHVU01195127.1~~GHVU01195127.1.p2  ORF type:complete len:117 (+),score=2.57 GHVU01195127.1:746-1096(+)
MTRSWSQMTDCACPQSRRVCVCVYVCLRRVYVYDDELQLRRLPSRWDADRHQSSVSQHACMHAYIRAMRVITYVTSLLRITAQSSVGTFAGGLACRQHRDRDKDRDRRIVRRVQME